MYERFIFLPIGLCLAFIAVHFHLSYFSAGVLIAIAIVLFDVVRGRDGKFERTTGYWFLGIGVMFLLVAGFVCTNYGISFVELDHQMAISKYLRRLPYFGIALVAMGAIIIAKSLFSKS